MENYSDMQKASRNFFRTCTRNAAEEFVREAKANEYVELTECLVETEGLLIEDVTLDSILKIEGSHEVYLVEREKYVAAFNRLNSLEKTILHSYYYGRATDKEIGDALGKSRTTIWEKRKGALSKMRRYLGEE